MTAGRDCPSDDRLAAYSEHPDQYPEVSEHAAACADCAAVAAILRRLHDLGVTPEMDAYLAELDALMAEVTSAPRHRWPLVLSEPRYQRADLARRFITAGLDARWNDPRRAIDLTKAATHIVSALETAAPEVADIRFDAWRYHSAVLREAGRYAECRAALVHAAEAAQQVRDVELAAAAVLFSRALLASEPDLWQPDEAAGLLDLVEAIYARRDPARWLRARTARATLLYRARDASCIGVYREVLEGTPQSETAAWHEALTNTLIGRVEFGETSSDIDEELAAAEVYYRAQNRRSVVARVHWLNGRVLALRKQNESAAELLERAIGEYQLMDDYDAAVRVSIDLIACMVAMERYASAIQICQVSAEWAMRLDRREPTRRRALTAEVMAYLRELAQRYALTEDVVLDVRGYVVRITNQRPAPFVPPLPLSTV